MKSEIILFDPIKKDTEGFILKKNVLSGEVADVNIEYISGTGPVKEVESASLDFYDVLFSLKGEAMVGIGDQRYRMGAYFVAKIPYNIPYTIHVSRAKEFHCLRFRKLLNKADCEVITKDLDNHSEVYIKGIKDCPSYTEDIKSSKTINRMILPEGMVPRFCMGSVETMGPDKVAEHKHPMLDQLLFGLEGCECRFIANDEEVVLKENMLLHVPLGSSHHTTVDLGNKLSYLWLDFFETIERQKYMNEQHHLNENQNQIDNP